MSRIGKKPIEIPSGVNVTISDGKINVKGPKGEIELKTRPEIKIEINGNQINLTPAIESKATPALWGTARSILSNAVNGVATGFEKKLEIEGVGYKANIEGNGLLIEVGYSHPVKFEKPQGIEFATAKNVITISGADKKLVGETAAQIRKIRPPEPYKGKGIRYVGEKIRRKLGKKATATA
jgi:large subunit ribosomal protein L6